MAINGAEINPVLQEWAPMSDVLNKVPTKTQIGIFNNDVSLTCVDILPEFIALGSNLGIVYWYDRKKKDMQRLRCENPNSKITTIKIISTVDYMVACGNCDGQISIFQIPKSHPDSLPESLKPKMKQVERYTVSELHSSAITSLEWSKNGMKLFSGDKNGLVVLTEIDFYMHLSKSVDILNEAYEVVQLSYCQQHLLVSTTYRTIVCQKQEKWKVCQVGKKDRKSLGNYGGVFLRNGLKPKDILIYCTRPGLRIWISDLNGTVQQTLLFKDLLSKECFEVPLINPITGYAKKLKPQREAMFGNLIPFADNLLVTYSSEIIYILDPTNLLVIATISHLRRILSVAAYKDELLVLEGERSLIRVSFKPEQFLSDSTNTIPTASTFLPIANSIKDLTNKLQTSSIISALPPLFENNLSTECNVHTDLTTVINAEEAYESSPLKKLTGTINNKLAEPKFTVVNQDNADNINFGLECLDLKKENVKKFEVFEKVGSEEFDDHILFKHRRRKKKSNLVKSEWTTSVTSLSSTSSDEKDSQVNRPCTLNVSTIGSIVPDLRSPDSILTDIESKEKILADMLNLDRIKIAVKKAVSKPDDNTNSKEKQNNMYPNNTSFSTITLHSKYNTSGNSETTDDQMFRQKQNNDVNKLVEKNGLSNIKEQKKNDQKEDQYSTESILQNIHPQGSEQTSAVDATFKNNSNQTFALNESVLNYGPPSGSSNQNSIEPPACLMIPNIWKLQEITINQDISEASDSSLCDWEII